MLSKITKRNLMKDSRVQGRKWLSTYGSYFSSEKILDEFCDMALHRSSQLPKNLNILYVGSASGLLGEQLARKLREKGFNPSLTLVDASKQHLAENRSHETEKINADLLTLNLKRKFDLAIMRSTLDYFPCKAIQIRVLKMIKAHLKKGGLFFNQCASLPTKTERNAADSVYCLPSFGRRHFQLHLEVKGLYEKAGFSSVRRVGFASPLEITEKEHVERYGLQKPDVEKVRRILSSLPKNKRKNLKTTKTGYKMKFTFPVYVARK